IDNESVMIQNRTQELVISDSDRRVIDSGEVANYTERIPLLPGEYEILVSVVDAASSSQTVRRTSTNIPDPNSTDVGITSVMLLGKDNSNDEGFIPITT